MNIESALSQMQEAGFSLKVLDGDKLSVSPGDQLTNTQTNFIRQYKRDLIKVLSQHGVPKLTDNDRQNIEEHLAERAAIQQFDGGLSRPEAERQAKSNMRVYHYRITDYPDSWMVMIAPGCDLTEARSCLGTKFQDRLIDVREYKFSLEKSQ